MASQHYYGKSPPHYAILCCYTCFNSEMPSSLFTSATIVYKKICIKYIRNYNNNYLHVNRVFFNEYTQFEQSDIFCISNLKQQIYMVYTHNEHLHNVLVLLSAYSKAKGFLCDLQCVVDGTGWCRVEAKDVLMGDFKPLIVGIINLRERKQSFQAVRQNSRCLSNTQLCIFLFFILNSFYGKW